VSELKAARLSTGRGIADHNCPVIEIGFQFDPKFPF